MADHDHHAKPAQPGRAAQAIGHRHPSEKAVAHRDQQTTDRIAKVQKAATPEALAKATKNRLASAHVVATRKSEGRNPRS